MVARRAHNPKVVGSSPASATTQDGSVFLPVRFLFTSPSSPVNEWINLKIGLRSEVRYSVDFDFIRRLQRHIENIARITGGSIDEDAMAKTMACIWRRKNPDTSIDNLWGSFGVD